MHPFVSRLHPSYRTAFVAWLFSRAICWGTTIRAGWGAVPVLHAPSYGRGAPLWTSWVRLCRYLEQGEVWFGLGVGSWTAIASGELAILGSAVAIYRFVRAEELPQTAERAVWLWALAPPIALTIPVSSWNFALVGAAVGLACLKRQRFLVGTAGFALAVGFRIETLLLWPGFVWLAYRSYRPGKDDGVDLWAAVFGPLAGFTATVGSAMLLAGRWGVSMRAVHPASSWRADWAWDGFGAEFPLLVAGVCAGIGMVLLLRNVGRDRGNALFAAAPCLLWPVVHDPVAAAAATVLLGIPAFAVLARHLENGSLERPTVVAATAGLALWLLA